jgi:cell division protein FtsZ
MGVKQIIEKPGAPSKVSQYDEEIREILEKRKTRIKVVGAGGAGNNTITRLMQVGIVGAETIAVNTDAQDLLYTDADVKVLIGKELTAGLGAGADPKVGMEAAKESKEDIKKALRGADMVFLTCGLGGGCLTGDSLIYTNPEGPVRIDSIQPNSFVYSLENGNIVKKRVLAAMKTGVKRTFEIKTKNYKLNASYDHPFLKVIPLNQDKKGRFSRFKLEWVQAESLKPGDLVVTLRKVPEAKSFSPYQEYSLNKDFCRLFGFLLGDGWITKSKKSWKICFSPSDKDKINRKYIRLIKETFGLDVKKSDNWYYANSKQVYELLEKLGLKRPARDKEIPSWIFELPDAHKKEFILGLADADGAYYRQKKKNGKEKIELRFEMGSEKLIRQLKVLCNYLGLRTSNIGKRTRIVKPPHSKQKIRATFWNVRIYKLFQLNKNLEKERRRKGIGFLYGYRGSTNSEFFKFFGFSRIKSVKEIGEKEVYDITVEGSHNFVAEGFVVHNTGTGSLPVIADTAKKMGALTVAVVTLPFSMEGKVRMANAREGLKNLEGVVDTLIVIPNDKLLEIVPDVSIATAFKVADEILVNAVKGITELVTKPGLVNLDFADVRAVMSQGGLAMIGMGESDTENRALEAVEKALNNPLITVDINGAKGALINVMGGPDITIKEAQQVCEAVSTRLSPDAKIIWGAQIAKELGDTVRALLIITGVKSPQIFGPEKPWSEEERKDIEKILGVEFL